MLLVLCGLLLVSASFYFLKRYWENQLFGPCEKLESPIARKECKRLTVLCEGEETELGREVCFRSLAATFGLPEFCERVLAKRECKAEVIFEKCGKCGEGEGGKNLMIVEKYCEDSKAEITIRNLGRESINVEELHVGKCVPSCVELKAGDFEVDKPVIPPLSDVRLYIPCTPLGDPKTCYLRIEGCLLYTSPSPRDRG